MFKTKYYVVKSPGYYCYTALVSKYFLGWCYYEEEIDESGFTFRRGSPFSQWYSTVSDAEKAISVYKKRSIDRKTKEINKKTKEERWEVV